MQDEKDIFEGVFPSRDPREHHLLLRQELLLNLQHEHWKVNSKHDQFHLYPKRKRFQADV